MQNISNHGYGNGGYYNLKTGDMKFYNREKELETLRLAEELSGIRAEIRVNTAGLYMVKVGTVAKRVMVND